MVELVTWIAWSLKLLRFGYFSQWLVSCWNWFSRYDIVNAKFLPNLIFRCCAWRVSEFLRVYDDEVCCYLIDHVFGFIFSVIDSEKYFLSEVADCTISLVIAWGGKSIRWVWTSHLTGLAIEYVNISFLYTFSLTFRARSLQVSLNISVWVQYCRWSLARVCYNLHTWALQVWINVQQEGSRFKVVTEPKQVFLREYKVS